MVTSSHFADHHDGGRSHCDGRGSADTRGKESEWEEEEVRDQEMERSGPLGVGCVLEDAVRKHLHVRQAHVTYDVGRSGRIEWPYDVWKSEGTPMVERKKFERDRGRKGEADVRLQRSTDESCVRRHVLADIVVDNCAICRNHIMDLCA